MIRYERDSHIRSSTENLVYIFCKKILEDEWRNLVARIQKIYLYGSFNPFQLKIFE